MLIVDPTPNAILPRVTATCAALSMEPTRNTDYDKPPGSRRGRSVAHRNQKSANPDGVFWAYF